MTAMAPIEGTVSISLGDMATAVHVGSFSIPVVTELHADGTLELRAAPAAAIHHAAYEALGRAVDELLASLPSAEVTPAHVATCATCGSTLASVDPTLRIVHAEDGAHVAAYTYDVIGGGILGLVGS